MAPVLSYCEHLHLVNNYCSKISTLYKIPKDHFKLLRFLDGGRTAYILINTRCDKTVAVFTEIEPRHAWAHTCRVHVSGRIRGTYSGTCSRPLQSALWRTYVVERA